MSDNAWHVVKNTPKVTGFVGPGARPTPLTPGGGRPDPPPGDGRGREAEAEVHVRAAASACGSSTGRSRISQGVVDEVNDDRNTLKVMVTIFGRSTPVELDFCRWRRSRAIGSGLWAPGAEAMRRRKRSRKPGAGRDHADGEEDSRHGQAADRGRQGDAGAARRDRRSARTGVNIMDFCKAFNAKTAKDEGLIIPVVITVYPDRSLHLHHQDAAGGGAAQARREHRQGLGRAEQEQGRHGHRRPGRGDRQAEDARPERGRASTRR